VYEEYLRLCSSKALWGAEMPYTQDSFGAQKRWLEIRVKYARFVDTLYLVRVSLQLPSQNLANKCIAKLT
jgi:hypothetical protein